MWEGRSVLSEAAYVPAMCLHRKIGMLEGTGESGLWSRVGCSMHAPMHRPSNE